MTDVKLETDDLSNHDLELITQWTGHWFGSPDTEPYFLNRALYVLGHRKLGLDTKLTYEHTRPLSGKETSTWVDAHWHIAPKESDVETDPLDSDPGPSSELG